MILPAEGIAERRIGLIQLRPAEIHGNLPGNDDFLRTAVSEELVLADADA